MLYFKSGKGRFVSIDNEILTCSTKIWPSFFDFKYFVGMKWVFTPCVVESLIQMLAKCNFTVQLIIKICLHAESFGSPGDIPLSLFG
jgi:hypothetical protein